MGRTGTGHAGLPTTLFSFNGTDGANTYGVLRTDAAGNLFGETTHGGANGVGTVFELSNTGFVPFLPLSISGTTASQAVTDAATIDPFVGVTITDPNTNQIETVSVTLRNPADR